MLYLFLLKGEVWTILWGYWDTEETGKFPDILFSLSKKDRLLYFWSAKAGFVKDIYFTSLLD